MGICYGKQLLCLALLGQSAVRRSLNGFEAGWCRASFSTEGQKLLGSAPSEVVWQHHFDEVTQLPPGSKILAANAHTSIQAFVNSEQRLFGTQFHPEFDKAEGDRHFREDRDQLEKLGYDLNQILSRSPTRATGPWFFGFFLNLFS